MKAQYVELIDAVATLGSMAAAAKALGKSQPAITKALKKIEADLGVFLFHRVPSGIVPTLEGQTVIDRCRRIQSDLQKLSEDVAQSRGQYVGMISVVVSPLAALKIIPPVMRRFQSRFPGVELNITGGHAPKAFHALRSGEADFVIGPAPDAQPKAGLHVEPLLTTSVTFLAGQQSHLKDLSKPQDLLTARWAVIGPSSRRPLFQDFFRMHGLQGPDPVIRSDSILSILSVIEQSEIVCSFPSLIVDEVMERWAVTALPIDLSMLTVDIALTWTKERLLTPAANAFADIVREEGRNWVSQARKT
ncbi:transcriptional regulator, LysR family protein [Roseibium aggregatum IAM 12614]|uniref:Transcriptional regulator, LysR family protein n=1 Tax=Roseibium aggregatum (strain ATCC 25650 / DSM 13394 / JCM 20685 / NBRC 16684 / NCIMB 2208 / IAM 12614 / B1) TaxID=384765 RepID=A0NP53_ROSAI|nr:LysR family transcriptional regulator [Roseibium aggregatum]EAV45216.1 transcriptional regulator, LysR family protein [Roseibium aggregatum IAM 12614]